MLLENHSHKEQMIIQKLSWKDLKFMKNKLNQLLTTMRKFYLFFSFNWEIYNLKPSYTTY
jgi:hypothetical protein